MTMVFKNGVLRIATQTELDEIVTEQVAYIPIVEYFNLTRRQLLLGLLTINIKEADVDAKIATLPADQIDVANINWKYASVYNHDDPLINQIAAMFGLTQDQIDTLWKQAETL